MHFLFHDIIDLFAYKYTTQKVVGTYLLMKFFSCLKSFLASSKMHLMSVCDLSIKNVDLVFILSIIVFSDIPNSFLNAI